jgi:hypothetical protein
MWKFCCRQNFGRYASLEALSHPAKWRGGHRAGRLSPGAAGPGDDGATIVTMDGMDQDLSLTYFICQVTKSI